MNAQSTQIEAQNQAPNTPRKPLVSATSILNGKLDNRQALERGTKDEIARQLHSLWKCGGISDRKPCPNNFGVCWVPKGMTLHYKVTPESLTTWLRGILMSEASLTKPPVPLQITLRQDEKDEITHKNKRLKQQRKAASLPPQQPQSEYAGFFPVQVPMSMGMGYGMPIQPMG